LNEHIYLNCAASSFPKPEAVLHRVQQELLLPPEAAGRSNRTGEPLTEQCRETVAQLIGCKPAELHFSSGATESANLILAGLDLKNTHVIATATEHNSILRPLFNHRDRPDISLVPCNADGLTDPSAIEQRIQPQTRFLFVNHCSNVTGCVQDLQSISAIARRHGILLIVDASQSIGCVDIDVERDGIDILIFTGHKNLFSLSGIGGYYLRTGIPVDVVKTGGTGTDSLWLMLPDGYTNREPGTPNLSGLVSLEAGTSYVRETGLAQIQRILHQKRSLLISGLTSIDGLHVFHTDHSLFSGPVVSFVGAAVAPADFGYILKESYGITVRTGYHCCPCIHDYLGTPNGTVRISFSVLTPEEHLLSLIDAVREIQQGVLCHGD